jgi:putative nucleotidyltransferase with HDIG domain
VDKKLLVKSVRNLPTPSPVLLKIGEVVQDPDSSADDITDVLRLDPALVSKVLKLANSAYVGLPRTVSSLQNAVVILGNKRIHSLVLSSELLNSIKVKKNSSISLNRFWVHSVITALVAESIAKSLRRYEIADEHEIFAGAMIHDIGKLVIAQLSPDEIKMAYEKAASEKKPFYLSEEPEIDHTVMGEYLADYWCFPPNLLSIIRNHHNPGISKEHILAVSIVHMSDITAHVLGYPLFTDEISPGVDNDAIAVVGLPLEQYRIIAENAISDKKKVDALVGMFGDK